MENYGICSPRKGSQFSRLIRKTVVVVGFFIFNHKMKPSSTQKTVGLKIRKQRQNVNLYVEHAQDKNTELKRLKKKLAWSLNLKNNTKTGNKTQNIHITQAVQPIDFHAIKPRIFCINNTTNMQILVKNKSSLIVPPVR